MNISEHILHSLHSFVQTVQDEFTLGIFSMVLDNFFMICYMLHSAPYQGKGTIRSEVYLEESYVNKNHCTDFVWYDDDGPWIQKSTERESA